MKKFFLFLSIIFLGLTFGASCIKAKEEAQVSGSAQMKQEAKQLLTEQTAGEQTAPQAAQQVVEQATQAALPQAEVVAKPKIILLIAEQNIEGPQRAWWASEVDLSTTEAAIAQNLIQQGYEVLEPSVLNNVIKEDKAFRIVDLTEPESIRLANLSKADYVVLGKAIASAGGRVPDSTMISCFANVTARLLRVRDGKVIAYLDAAGNSVHLDTITGGREALGNAGQDLAAKVVDALNKEGGK